MKAEVHTCTFTRLFKSSHSSFCPSLYTPADDFGESALSYIITHFSDSIPLRHHCAFCHFSCPLSNFSELSCKADTFSSWILLKSFNEGMVFLPRLGMGSTFLLGKWKKTGNKRWPSSSYHISSIKIAFQK